MASLAHAQRESRETPATKTPGPARPTLALTAPTAQIWTMITYVNVVLAFPERTVTKDITAIVHLARTEVHVKRRLTVQPSVSASRVTRVQTALKTWMNVPALLVKTEVYV